MANEVTDAANGSAWAGFRTSLADYVAAMRDEDCLLLAFRRDDAGEDSPCVRFFAWDATLVRCEIPDNPHLHPAFALTQEQRRRLLDLCWQPPTVGPVGPDGSPAHHIDLPRLAADRLAAAVVTVFTEIWGVPDPALLDAVTSGRPTTPPFAVRPALGEIAGISGVAVPTADAAELRALVHHAIATALGHPPLTDSDGDILLRLSGRTVAVTVDRNIPMVEVYSLVARDIDDRRLAALGVTELNARNHVVLNLVGDAVLAAARVDAAPFVARHLINALADMAEFLDEVGDDMLAELGVNPTAPTPDEDRLPAALEAILRLDRAHPGVVEPDEAARLCGNDRAQLLDYRRICADQVAEWEIAEFEAAVAGQHDDAEHSHDEGAAWARARKLLDAALDRPRPGRRSGSNHGVQLSLFAKPSEATLFDGE
ncbi:MAG TPA: hypothetical protein VIW24_13675 [Aldersonia sp.]